MWMHQVLPEDWRDVPHKPDNPPFWAVPWPCGTALAGHLLCEPSLVQGQTVADVVTVPNKVNGPTG